MLWLKNGWCHGAIHGSTYGIIYDTIHLTIYHYGLHNRGAGAIYGALCPTINGTTAPAKTLTTTYKLITKSHTKSHTKPHTKSHTKSHSKTHIESTSHPFKIQRAKNGANPAHQKNFA